MWSEEEKKALSAAWTASACEDGTLIDAIATRAVELVAARGGTMTAERLSHLRNVLAAGAGMPGVALGNEAVEHITTLGARLAMLEAGNKRWQGQYDELRAENGALSANLTEACRKADEQRERAEAAEESRRAVIMESDTWRQRANAAESRLQYIRDSTLAISNRCVEMAKVAGEPPASAPSCDCATKNIACIHWARRAIHRYPCSPTCTHDDAATPGHPERVKERSGKFTSAASLANGYVRASDTAALFGAQEPDGHPLSMARREGFNEGAEAMRAACLTESMRVLDEEGLGHTSILAKLKAAVEGATP